MDIFVATKFVYTIALDVLFSLAHRVDRHSDRHCVCVPRRRVAIVEIGAIENHGIVAKVWFLKLEERLKLEKKT